MKRITFVGVAATMLVACATVRPTQVPLAHETPAPGGAVLCAVEEAAGFGFYPEEGGLEAVSARLVRRIDYTIGDIARELGTRVVTLGFRGRNRLQMEHLTLTEGDGMLRAHLIAMDERGLTAQPSARSVGEVRVLMSACAS